MADVIITPVSESVFNVSVTVADPDITALVTEATEAAALAVASAASAEEDLGEIQVIAGQVTASASAAAQSASDSESSSLQAEQYAIDAENAVIEQNGGVIIPSDTPVSDSIIRNYRPQISGTYTNFGGITVDITTGENYIIGSTGTGFKLVTIPLKTNTNEILKYPLPTTDLNKFTYNVNDITSTTHLTSPATFVSRIGGQVPAATINPVYRYNTSMAILTFPYFPEQNTPVKVGTMVEFYCDSRYMDVLGYAGNTRITVIVDNVIVTPKVTYPSGGGNKWFLIDFGTKAKRHIKISLFGKFGGVYTEAGGLVTQYVKTKKKLVFDGDSITEGSLRATTSDMWLYSVGGIIAQKFDWDYYNAAIGGSGYVTLGNQGQPNMLDRLPANIFTNIPDVFCSMGGLNDSSLDMSVVTPNINAYWDSVKLNMPNTLCIAISPFNPSNTFFNNIEPITEVVRKAALRNGFPFIDTLHSKTYDSNGSLITVNTNGVLGNYITGTGNEASPVNPNDGNRYYYISNDNTHPTNEGHRYFGLRIAAEIYKILNFKTGYRIDELIYRGV